MCFISLEINFSKMRIGVGLKEIGRRFVIFGGEDLGIGIISLTFHFEVIVLVQSDVLNIFVSGFAS